MKFFGRVNRIETLVWKKSYGGGAKSPFVVNQHEYILCFARDLTQAPLFFLPPREDALRYYKFRDEQFEAKGPYRLQPLATTSMDSRPNLRYPIYTDDGEEIWPDKQWQWSEDRVKEARAQGEIVITKRKERFAVSYKQYLRDEEGEERRSKPASVIDGVYTQQGTYESIELFGLEGKFSFPKPEGLIGQLVECCSRPGDLVLDSFAGSGTTGAVAHKMGRRWIMVELGEHCHTHIIPRLRKVIEGEDPGGITQAVGWKGGGGFRYYRLAPSLLERDRWGNWVISKQYNAAMLAEAVCKLEGFRYAPSETVWWQHGQSTERDFIYVTTQTLSRDQIAALSEEVGETRTLLVCCGAFRGRPGEIQNLTVQKIPKAVLHRCEWGRDDYSLRISTLPEAEPESEVKEEARVSTQRSPEKADATLPLFEREVDA